MGSPSYVRARIRADTGSYELTVYACLRQVWSDDTYAMVVCCHRHIYIYISVRVTSGDFAIKIKLANSSYFFLVAQP